MKDNKEELTEEMKEILKKVENNSLKSKGIKPIKVKRLRAIVTLKKNIAVLLAPLFILSSGCFGMKQVIDSRQIPKTTSSVSFDDVKQWHSYSCNEIIEYSKDRVIKILEQNGLDKYYLRGDVREYQYNAEDYKKVSELNSSNILGFYYLTDNKSLNQYCISLGYAHFHDYLKKNGYTDENDEELIDKWLLDSFDEIGKLMESREEGKTK